MCLRRRLPWPLEPRESTEPEARENIRAKNGFFMLPEDEGEDGDDGVRGVRGAFAGGVCVYIDAELGTCGARSVSIAPRQADDDEEEGKGEVGATRARRCSS